MLALSTRTSKTTAHGLSAGILSLAELNPAAWVLECTRGVGSWPSVVEVLRKSGAPVWGVCGSLVTQAHIGGREFTVVDENPEHADQAFQTLLASKGRLREVKARSWAIPLPRHAGDFPKRNADEHPAAFAQRTRGLREQLAERLCRQLFRLEKSVVGLPLVLTPGDPVWGFLNLETTQWILEDRPHLKLALDLGGLSLKSHHGAHGLNRWFESVGSRLAWVFVSDHNGEERSNLMPGMGLTDWNALLSDLGPSLGRVLRPDPNLEDSLLPVMAETALQILGGGGLG